MKIEIELIDNITQLKMLWSCMKRQKNEFLPCEELDNYETSMMVFEEAIDKVINKLSELVDEEVR